jgi:hypothetical protein
VLAQVLAPKSAVICEDFGTSAMIHALKKKLLSFFKEIIVQATVGRFR